jgi:hypothetical protein
MEVIGLEKPGEWTRKVRNASMEKAEEMMEHQDAKNRREIGLMKHSTDYVIVKFYCADCHRNHLWGGTKKYRLSIEFEGICPKKSNKLYFMNQFPVPRRDALHYAPKGIRKLIFKDEASNIFK